MFPIHVDTWCKHHSMVTQPNAAGGITSHYQPNKHKDKKTQDQPLLVVLDREGGGGYWHNFLIFFWLGCNVILFLLFIWS